MAEAEIEAIAQAFDDSQDCARGWTDEPGHLKAQFRDYAKAAIATLDGQRQGTMEPRWTDQSRTI